MGSKERVGSSSTCAALKGRHQWAAVEQLREREYQQVGSRISPTVPELTLVTPCGKYAREVVRIVVALVAKA